MIEVTRDISSRFRKGALICSFLVVVIHCVSHFGPKNIFVERCLYDGVCRVAVPFFFFASGFFFAGHIGSKQWYWQEVKKRVQTLIIPFLIFSSAYWALCLLFKLVNNTFVSAPLFDGVVFTPNVILNVYGLNPLSHPLLVPLWYLRGLFILVVISPIIIFFARLKIGLLILFLMYFFVCPWEGFPGDMTFLLRKFLPLQGVFYFSFGVGLRFGTVPNFFRASNKQAIFLLAIGIVFLTLKTVLQQKMCFGYYYAGCLAVPFLLIALLTIICNFDFNFNFAETAFPVYLIHMFVIDFFVVLLRSLKIQIEGRLFVWLLVVVIVYLTSVLCVLVQRRYIPSISKILYGGR